ncbi:MAG: hypothetical protein QM756_33890 [Polyangiaceae bacterium]
MRARHRASMFALSLAVLSAAAPVRAQAPEAKSAAEALFDEGRRLMNAGQYAEACVKFADSNNLDPGLGTLLNLGQCYKSLGRTASAWSTYREAAALARSSGQADREDLARKEAAALEGALARLVVLVPSEVAALHPQLTRDGVAMPPSMWGLSTPIDPGKHVVEATAPGKRPQRLELSVAQTAATTTLTIPPFQDEAAPAAALASSNVTQQGDGSVPAAPPAAVAPEASRADRSGLRLTGFVLGGIGVAAAATGGVFLFLGKQQNQEALALCTAGDDGRHCLDPTELSNHQRHVDAARNNFLIGYVGLGVGAAGIATGALMLALGAKSSSNSALVFTPRIAASGVGFDLGGKF